MCSWFVFANHFESTKSSLVLCIDSFHQDAFFPSSRNSSTISMAEGSTSLEPKKTQTNKSMDWRVATGRGNGFRNFHFFGLCDFKHFETPTYLSQQSGKKFSQVNSKLPSPCWGPFQHSPHDVPSSHLETSLQKNNLSGITFAAGIIGAIWIVSSKRVWIPGPAGGHRSDSEPGSSC